MSIEIAASHRVAEGTLRFCAHQSEATGTRMRFAAFIPPGAGPFPYLIWLSGLTATEENFMMKAGAFAAAAQHGVALIAPDTSPRGEDAPNDPDCDLGQGASFYVDATQAPWSRQFRMETYVTRDLIAAAEGAFALAPRRGISGHSMGGHGALTLAMKHPEIFASVSAFAPIASPTRCPWGEKAFAAYLGADRTAWAAHDSALLLAAGRGARFDSILVDQGLADPYLDAQLKPDLLEAAAKGVAALQLRRREGYDHSYFFIASFIADHVAHHAARLR
jgi:S-formylglutathione hydrolase